MTVPPGADPGRGPEGRPEPTPPAQPKQSGGAPRLGVVGIAVAVVLAVAVVVLFATGVFSPDHSDDAGDSMPAGSSSGSEVPGPKPPDPKHTDPKSTPSASSHRKSTSPKPTRSTSTHRKSSATPARIRYGYTDDFCARVNLSAFETGKFRPAEPPGNATAEDLETGTGTMSCITLLEDDQYGVLDVAIEVETFGSRAEAVKRYKSMKREASRTPRHPVPGPWADARSAGKPKKAELKYGLYVQAENLAAYVSMDGYDVPWGNKADTITKKVITHTMSKLEK